MGDEIGRVRIGRDRIDLQLDTLDALDMQSVDIERAGMAMPCCRIERGLDLTEFIDKRALYRRILVVDDEAQRVVATAAPDQFLAEIEAPPA